MAVGGPALPAGAGRYHVLGIQALGHPSQAPACRAEFEETADDGSLRRIGLACDVLPLWAAVGPWGGDLDVVVAIDAPAGDVTGPGLPKEGVMGALLGALALKLARIAGDGQEHLVGGGVEGAFPGFQVEEDPHSGIENLFEGIAGFDGFAPQPGLLGHDEDVKGRTGPEGVHEPEEARALDELGAADAVIDVDGFLADDPPMLGGVVAGMLDLAGDGALLVAHADLIGRLPPVDGGEQGTRAVSGRTASARTPAHAEAPSVPVESIVSVRSRMNASARAETTAVNTAGGHNQDGSARGPRGGGVPRCHVLTLP